MMIRKLPILFFLTLLLISGCATIPTGENIAAYSISGVTYYPLVTLCDLRGVGMQYDALLRTAYLSRDAQQVSLRVGDNLVLVNNNAMHLNSPIDVYQGTIAVPRQFKEQVFDVLFKRAVLVGRRAIGKIKLNKVVIDAGHGGNDPGAIGRNNLKEKDVNLDIA
ncbi:MAG: N-acetylmuramoyl-L-alanine amidase, partial [Candidatus Omnitrophota bacterium]|nr:N-acetylmuramoyl-L-alanine amidase [Candidatus Omnitrophota bacterium]